MGTNHETNRDPLSDLLARRGALVADGGMGTSLFAMGLRPGGTPELWNVEQPDRVAEVHRGFATAGADIILTNTFGGTRTRLALDHLEDRSAELNVAAVRVARDVAKNTDRTVLVAGSVGPTGALFEPLGPMTEPDAIAIFGEQIEALDTAEADIIWIETMSSLEELQAALLAAANYSRPVVTTMSFDTSGSTMMGVSPGHFARWIQDAPVAPVAIGANCGVGPADAILASAEMRASYPEAVIVAKSNCGVPQVIDGTLWYPASTDDMTAYARFALDAGARIIGACCGSMPEHIEQIRAAVDAHDPASGVVMDEVEAALGQIARPKRNARRRAGRRSARATG